MHPPIAERYAMVHGATDPEIAKIIGVSHRTLCNWKKRHPEFLQAVNTGKDVADDIVEQSLYNRAIGMPIKEKRDNAVTGITLVEKELAPDTKAIEIWLTNRRPKKWRRKEHHEVTGKDGKPLHDDNVVTRVNFVFPDNGRDPHLRKDQLIPASTVLVPNDGGNGTGDNEEK